MLKLVKGLDQKLAMESMVPMRLKLDFFAGLVKIIKETRDVLRKNHPQISKKTILHDLRLAEREQMHIADIWNVVNFVSKVSELVMKKTGLFLTNIKTGAPAIRVPMIGDHIFRKEILNRYKGSWETNHSEKTDILTLMTKLKEKSLSGEIDLKEATVSGAFSLIELELYMCPIMFIEHRYSDEEIAAIMLHEFGHAYTIFLYLNRSLLNNQVLAAMARTYEGSFSVADRIYVFEHFCNENKITEEQKTAMKKCKNIEELTVVYMAGEVDACKSELGYSLYDVNSCEMLADQYVTRCGAGKFLANGLHKIHVDYHMTDSGLWYFRIMSRVAKIIIGFLEGLFNLMISTVLGGFSFIISIILMIYALVFSSDKRNEIYDNPYARLNRIKQQSIDKLKDDTLSKDEKELYLSDIQSVDNVLDNYSDGIKLGEVIAYILNPAFRRAHKFEMLQKELETLASNKLFVSAAKLKMI